MTKIITKPVTVIIILTLALTLAMPMQAEAKAKTTPKLSKTKVTLNMAKKKTKTCQLKVKGTSKKVKWKTRNKKVATVSKNGKITAKKKGTTVITAKVGKKTLKCKVTVKDTRKKSNTNNHEHQWVPHSELAVENISGAVCACGKVFTSADDWSKHSTDEFLKNIEQEGTGEHASFSGGKSIYITWIWHYDCDICGFHDYDYKYPHPIKSVICSGCGKEFKNEKEWKKHFMENSINGDDSHNEFTVRL